MKKVTAISGFSKIISIKEIPQTLEERAVYLFNYVKRTLLFLVKNKIAKRDNSCEHCDK